MSTLDSLIRVSRSKPVRRELCCPERGMDVVLADGVLRCLSIVVRVKCGWEGTRLAELAVKQ